MILSIEFDICVMTRIDPAVAPKKTSTSEWETFMPCSSLGRFFQVTAEAKTHGGKHPVGVISFTTR